MILHTKLLMQDVLTDAQQSLLESLLLVRRDLGKLIEVTSILEIADFKITFAICKMKTGNRSEYIVMRFNGRRNVTYILSVANAIIFDCSNNTIKIAYSLSGEVITSLTKYFG